MCACARVHLFRSSFMYPSEIYTLCLPLITKIPRCLVSSLLAAPSRHYWAALTSVSARGRMRHSNAANTLWQQSRLINSCFVMLSAARPLITTAAAPSLRWREEHKNSGGFEGGLVVTETMRGGLICCFCSFSCLLLPVKPRSRDRMCAQSQQGDARTD